MPGLLFAYIHPVFEMTRLHSALFGRNVHKFIICCTEYSVPKVKIDESLPYLIPLGILTSSLRSSGGSLRGVSINIGQETEIVQHTKPL